MSETDERFYITVRKRDGKIVGHGVSFDQPSLDLDLPDKSDETSDEPNNTVEPKPGFDEVFNTFRSTTESYRKFIKITLGVAPGISAAIAEYRIGDFVQEKGKELPSLSNESRTVYEFDMALYGEFRIIDDEISAALDGAKHLPEVMIIGLISVYDAFLSRLLAVILDRHEEIILTSEKTIKLSELSAYGSIEHARSALISREIESVIRLSHHEQFSWMERKLAIPLRSDLPVWPSFVELCERRNLITHTGGIVSAQYIENCKEHGVDVSSVAVGERLKVDGEYFARATDIVIEIGTKLCHVLWRKFAKDERERADDVLNQFCYSLIYERSYKIAEILLTFGTKTLKQHGSEKTRRMMIVNLANAIRLQKREPEAIALLDREDWSASGEEFQLCVAAVKGEIDRVVELMKRMGASGSITREDYRNWPVFRGIRTNPKFGATFEAVFGVPFATPKQPVLEKAPASSSVH